MVDNTSDWVSGSQLYCDEELSDFITKVEEGNAKWKKYRAEINQSDLVKMSEPQRRMLRNSTKLHVVGIMYDNHNLSEWIRHINFAYLVQSKWLIVTIHSWCPVCNVGCHDWLWVNHVNSKRNRCDLVCPIMDLKKKDVFC